MKMQDLVSKWCCIISEQVGEQIRLEKHAG